MNKKLKSLLIAGLLVVGMGGSAFAAEPITPTITNPKFEEGQKVVELQDGSIVLEMSEQEGFYYYVTVKWDSAKYKITDVITFFEDGSVVYNEALFRDDDCGVVIEGQDGWRQLNMVNDVDNKLVKVVVKCEPIDEDGNGTPDFKDDDPVTPEPDPEPKPEPEEDIDDPITGDSGMMIGVVTAAISTLGLVVVNKKKDE